MDKKKILIVEDTLSFHKEWKARFERKKINEKLEVLSAFTIKKAKKIFTENSDLTLIVVDACVPGVKINTQLLVKKFRESFKGPIVAASSSFYNNQKLINAGCDYASNKEGVPDMIQEVLNL